MSWFGNIEIGKVINARASAVKKTKAAKEFKDLKETDVRFVHYPDCQQLTIWLPHPGVEYGILRLRNNGSKKITEEFPVNDKLSGSIQVLWDTTTVPPGDYTIEIDWKDGCLHRINFVKYKEEKSKKKKPADPPAKTVKPKKEKQDKPIVYKDGFGNIIPDEDLILREKLNKELQRKFSRRIEYEGNIRAGSVIYIDSDTRIEFSNEMGGGDCMVYISIPTEEQWEAATKTALSRRKEILEYVAEVVLAQQTYNCYFEIKGNEIGFYYK